MISDVLDGDGEAEYACGEGHAKREEWLEAETWYRRAVEKGHGSAHLALAALLESGKTGSPEIPEAVSLYERFIDRSEPDLADYDRHLNSPPADETAEMLARADSDVARNILLLILNTTECSLGKRYMFGHGLPVDEQRGFRWFLRAAEHGNAEAALAVGRFYETGEGTTIDLAETFRWYTRAAEKGDTTAQLMVGLALLLGKGVPRDPFAAHGWFLTAAGKNDAVANDTLGAMYLEGIDVPKDVPTARHFFELARRLGSKTAEKELEKLDRDPPYVGYPSSKCDWKSCSVRVFSKAGRLKLAGMTLRLCPQHLPAAHNAIVRHVPGELHLKAGRIYVEYFKARLSNLSGWARLGVAASFLYASIGTLATYMAWSVERSGAHITALVIGLTVFAVPTIITWAIGAAVLWIIRGFRPRQSPGP